MEQAGREVERAGGGRSRVVVLWWWIVAEHGQVEEGLVGAKCCVSR